MSAIAARKARDLLAAQQAAQIIQLVSGSSQNEADVEDAYIESEVKIRGDTASSSSSDEAKGAAPKLTGPSEKAARKKAKTGRSRYYNRPSDTARTAGQQAPSFQDPPPTSLEGATSDDDEEDFQFGFGSPAAKTSTNGRPKKRRRLSDGQVWTICPEIERPKADANFWSCKTSDTNQRDL